jgi:hypothetical protein
MAEHVVGYKVLVYDAPEYVPNARILHEHDFLASDKDEPGYQLRNALRYSEMCAQ